MLTFALSFGEQKAKLSKSLYNPTFTTTFVQILYQYILLTNMSVLTLKFYYHMKFGIIKERKNPPDRRVVFSPEKLVEAKAQFPQAEFVVESSDIRNGNINAPFQRRTNCRNRLLLFE